jgi:hypothetical protein
MMVRISVGLNAPPSFINPVYHHRKVMLNP